MRIAASSGARVSAMLPTGPLLMAYNRPKASHNHSRSQWHGSEYIAIDAEPEVCVSGSFINDAQLYHAALHV